MKRRLTLVCLAMGALSVVMYSARLHSSHKPLATPGAAQWVQAGRKSQTLSFYFKGVLRPIRTQAVLSPLEGVVQQVSLIYGSAVKRGDVLLTIQPTKLAESFRSLLAEYLQKKAVYAAQQTKFAGDQALFKAGVIAKQDYLSAKDSLATSALEFQQAKLELDKVLAPLQLSGHDVEKLELSDTQSVTQLLARDCQPVTVRAPSDGVVLIPLKSSGEASAAAAQTQEEIKPGLSLKEQEPIVSLGDLSGYEIDVQVSELDIVQLSPGLPAVVTGDAFPGVELAGTVTQVAAQADPNQNNSGSVTLFRVTVQVPKVPAAVQAQLRVGMSAKVAIQLQTPPQVTVPIGAVFIRQGKTWVTQRASPSAASHDQVVQTGVTTAAEVAILQGLPAGAWVKVSEQAHD